MSSPTWLKWKVEARRDGNRSEKKKFEALKKKGGKTEECYKAILLSRACYQEILLLSSAKE